MNAARFFVLHSLCYISGHPEVWVLVNTLWNKTEHILVISEDMGEGSAEGRHSLDSWESNSSAGMAISDPENSLALVVGKHVLKSADIRVHGSDVHGVLEYESLVLLKATGNNILSVLKTECCIMGNILFLACSFHEIFFIVGKLDNQGAVEDLLHPLGENEG